MDYGSPQPSGLSMSQKEQEVLVSSHVLLVQCVTLLFSGAELHLMFSLMDKVPNGIEPMLKDLEEHIISAGLADMVAAAETITTVRAQTHTSATTVTRGRISQFLQLFPSESAQCFLFNEAMQIHLT